jgi:hypothetical protein
MPRFGSFCDSHITKFSSRNSFFEALGGFAAFEPSELSPALRAAIRKNESFCFAFFLIAKAAN